MVLSLFFIETVNAQLNIFIGPGATYYLGDLKNTPLPGLQTTHFSYKLGLGYDWNSQWGIKFQYMDGAFSGNDAYATSSGRKNRGIAFKSDYKELAVLLKYKWNNFPNSGNWDLYFLGGVEGFQFSPQMDYSQARKDLLPENSFATKQLAVPVGLGAAYWFTPRVGVLAEGLYHYTFTDYLDGVSKNGNDKLKDALIDAHVTLLLRLGAKGNGIAKENNYTCPTFK